MPKPEAIKALASTMAANVEAYVRQWLPDGTVAGPEYVVLCPFHTERTPSFNVNLRSGKWTCRGCNVAGHDLISLYAKLNNMKNGEAASALSDGVASTPRTPTRAAPAKDDWEPVVCEEPQVAISLRHFKHGEPAVTWKYYDADGMFVGWICRFNSPGPKALPYCRCRYTGEPTQHYEPGKEYWRWHSFAPPRPLWNLPTALLLRNAPILIVEGEKTADAAQRLLPDHVVVTWPGGCKAVTHSNFTPLTGRNVTIWPDADPPGIQAAWRIKGVLPQARIVAPPDGVAAGWDLADADASGWTTERVLGHMEASLIPEPSDATDTPEPNGQPGPNGHTPTEPPATPAPNLFLVGLGAPFTPLGFNRGTYYYMSHATRQVVPLEPSAHTHMNLLQLAPKDTFWERHFQSKQGVNWSGAGGACMLDCHNIGIYDPNRIRGRGCWLDGGNVVFHAGNQLFVNGCAQEIVTFNSPGRCVYEQTCALDYVPVTPSPPAQASQLIEICELLPWRNPISGMLLAGWCAVAPVCGVLPWRPHIWVTGSAKTGKTWTVDNVIRKILAQFCVHIQGASSEAGIRQLIGCDALPAVFDESESQTKPQKMKMEAVIELARASSSETDAKIVKGSMSGEAHAYTLKSAFCFISIGVAATLRADTSRVTVLELVRHDPSIAVPRFESLKARHRTVFLPGFCDAVRARSITLAREIRENAIVLARVISRITHDSRTGDQLGALFAGTHILGSSAVLTEAQADRWMRSMNLEQSADTADDDETQALNHLFDSHIKDGPYVRSIGELLQLSFGRPTNDSEVGEKEAAKATLMRHGIAVDEDSQAWYVSNSHQALYEIYADTPWAGKWKDQMLRATGAEQGGMRRFGASTHRCVRLPWTGHAHQQELPNT